jgi:hypothetical protein
MSDSQIRVGHWEADGGDVNIPLGFIPDYMRVVEVGVTNPNMYEWFERQEDDEASGAQEGNILTGSTGVVTQSADSQGITAYDTGSQQPAAGTGAGQLQEWTASQSYTARTATAAGSYAKPTVGATDDTGGVADRDAIFECVTSGTSGSTEPTWPSAIGGQVLDSTPVWEKVNTATFRGGYQGVVVANEIQTNSREYYYLAIKAHDSVDHGDVDGWSGGVDPDWR